jgi:hypothetical protein
LELLIADFAIFVFCSAFQALGAEMADKQEGYTISVDGPDHKFKRAIDEAMANRILNLIMTGSLPAGGGEAAGSGSSGTARAGAGAAAIPSGLNPKQFIASKKPKTQYERVACIADYLTNARNTPQFDNDAIAALNTEAAQAPIKNIGAILRDTAQKYGYLSAAGNGGNKQITVLGEAVVTALPDRDAVKAAITENRPSRKRKRAAKKKK